MAKRLRGRIGCFTRSGMATSNAGKGFRTSLQAGDLQNIEGVRELKDWGFVGSSTERTLKEPTALNTVLRLSEQSFSAYSFNLLKGKEWPSCPTPSVFKTCRMHRIRFQGESNGLQDW